MFKLFLTGSRHPRNGSSRSKRPTPPNKPLPLLLLAKIAPALLLLAGSTWIGSGCRSHPLPPIDLKQGGWTLRQGEAVWRPKKDLPEIAGELLIAYSNDGSFVQFTKNPFPMVLAQTRSNRWELQFPLEQKRITHGGGPPRRILWFQLPRLLLENKPVKGWTLEQSAEHWRVANETTGESLEGILNP
jgi:hypothetical protein